MHFSAEIDPHALPYARKNHTILSYTAEGMDSSSHSCEFDSSRGSKSWIYWKISRLGIKSAILSLESLLSLDIDSFYFDSLV